MMDLELVFMNDSYMSAARRFRVIKPSKKRQTFNGQTFNRQPIVMPGAYSQTVPGVYSPTEHVVNMRIASYLSILSKFNIKAEWSISTQCTPIDEIGTFEVVGFE